MGDKTKIEWTDASWTPIRARFFEIQNDGSGKERIGWHCEHVTEGCRNCYAETMNRRLGTGLDFKPGNLFREEREGYANGEAKLFLDQQLLVAPTRWKRPRRIFVCSMTDLFASFVPDEFVHRMMAIMAFCQQHTFQILTKRPDRMREYFRGQCTLPNVWLGTSVEDQTAANSRIPHLVDIDAAVHFLSCEPLLGPVDLSTWLAVEQIQLQGRPHWTERTGDVAKLQWVICGGESGPNARPMHPIWSRLLRDQCAAADVPFHFKQWGEWAPYQPVAGGDLGRLVRTGKVTTVHPTGQTDLEVFHATGGRNTVPGTCYVERLGKGAAGRCLDSREHDGFPG